MDREKVAAELNKLLGPEYIRTKQGHAYVEGHNAVNLANEIFGFDGWSSEIRELEIGFEEVKNRKYTVLATCIMRVTLSGGSFHEDTGSGVSINMPARYMAYEKARKEAVTDALKRTLRVFGQSLGNCLYNKDFCTELTRMKPEKFTFNQEDIRRPQKRVRLEAPLQPAESSDDEFSQKISHSAACNPTSMPNEAPNLSTTAVSHSTPIDSKPAAPSIPLDMLDDFDDFASELGSEGPIAVNISDSGFTSGAGYDDDAGAQPLRTQPYDVSKSFIPSAKLPQDHSGKVFK